MQKKQVKGLTPTRLRIVLLSLIVLSFALCAIGFWFFRNQLVTYAEEVQTTNTAASASSDDILKLQKLQKQLADDAVAVTRAKSIVADSQYYEYQNQIISDITAYAKNSNVSITGFTFSDNSTAASASAVKSTTTTTTPVGLKSTTASITIKNPVTYANILKFIHSIELNLTKMQLSGISITGSTATPNEVTVNPITVEVYTR
jgi:hypothetical protein